MSAIQSIRFSVIIAVYNGEKFIQRAIDSVLSQTYPPLEVIVVDDGSTDCTAEIVNNYGPPVRLICQSNQGVSKARNVGVEHARGDWITFLDADDYYYPRRLALAAELIQQYSDVDFVTADFDYVDEEENLIRRSLYSTDLGQRILNENKSAFYLLQHHDFGDFIEDHFGDTHTLTVPRKTFLELGGYPSKYMVCEDVHFLIRLCSRSKVAGVICRPVAAYVIHPNSATRSDPIRAQLQTVSAWRSLAAELESASPALKAGYRKGLSRARYNHSVALLRAGRKWQAILSILPLLYETPSLDSFKKILSVIKG